jgi:signal transduction histidine kinase
VLLFQIVRELLFNVVKHAGTAEATIRVGPAEGGGVRVVVSDEGVGFELDNADDEATGAGLVSVRERIRLVGGSVDVRSAPDSGTEIEIVCPTEL